MRSLGRILPYLVIAWLYVATTPYHRGLNNPNEMVRVYMSVAAVEDGTFAIDGVVKRWGNVDDKAERDGRLYSSKAPLHSLLGVPAYAVGRKLLDALGLPKDARHATFVLRYLASVPIGLALACVLLAWARARTRAMGAPASAGTAVGLTLALGTMHFPYGITFTGHILAAACAGGCFLALALLHEAPEGSRRGFGLSVLAGLLGGAAPFAEYPSALVALPAIVGALLLAPSRTEALRRLAGLALGGFLPFGLGLWAHARLWGSPLSTGYSFLENASYMQVHDEGFFGVSAPSAEALRGTLFSPGTGLFWFSPVLAVGLVFLLRRLIWDAPDGRPGRKLAIVSLVAFALSLLFMSAHGGWRGGWTVGPRYIIAVVPVLGFWCVEAVADPRWRAPLLTLGALSILWTGSASALYPHLSDVYTNPLWSFLVPAYARGANSYGIAHALGLSGHLANLLHLAPLVGAALAVGLAARTPTERRRWAWVLGGFVLGTALLWAVPEAHPAKARRESRRLERMWEPKSEATVVTGPTPSRSTAGSARRNVRNVSVRRILPDGSVRPCEPARGPCKYGQDPWQHFGPEALEFDGRKRAVLFMHPIAGDVIEARVPVPADVRRAELVYGLSDGSIDAPNPHPVELQVLQGTTLIGVAQAGHDYGLQRLELPLTSSTALRVQVRAEQDGARVLGWDLEFFRERP